MKNKRNVYILLPIVIGIWGMVIYTFFSFTSPEMPIENNIGTLNIKPLVVKEKDTFSIKVNYRDPFLGKMHQPKTAGKKPLKKIAKKEEEVIVWPSIIYKGIVSDNKEKKKVFMVVINGQTFFMKENDSQSDVLLKGGDRKTITVRYMNKLNKIAIQG